MTSVSFRVLGPLEVVRGADLVEVGGPTQRRALAALLTTPGEVVRLESLIDAVWGDQVPATAVRTLQASLSRLRSRIAPATIERAAGGYRLHTETASIDWQMLSVAMAGDDCGVLRSALGLWRERPFPELVDWEPAAALTSRLVELRANGLERVIRAELERSDPGTLIPELEAVLTEEPLREGLWVLLIDALRRAGRRADALAAYGRAETVLGDELGVEPSLLVKAAAQRTQDEADVIWSMPGGRPRLPMQRTALVGRTDDLDRISTALASHQLVTLSGIGGVGKTRLALAVASEVEGAYTSGVYWVELASISDLSGLIGQISTAIGLPGSTEDLALRLTQLASWLAARDLLLVLDNCEHVIDETAEFVDQLLDSGDCCTVLATSRERLDLDGEQTIPLAGLSSDAATELLMARAQEMHGSSHLLDHARGQEICRALDGLPLAIELAAARLDQLSVAELQQELEHRFEVLGEGRRRGQRRGQTLRRMMDWSWSLLDETERQFLADLSVCRGGFTTDAAATVGNQPSAGELLASLQAKSLVTAIDHPTGRRFDLLETVRLYAAGKLNDAGHSEDSHDRHLAWATRFAEQLLVGIHTTDESTWVARTDVEMANLVAASEWAFQRGHIDRLLELLQLVEPECFLRLRPALGPLAARLIERLDRSDDERLGIALAVSFRLGQGSMHPKDLFRSLGPGPEQELMASYPLSRLLFAARIGAQGNPAEAATIVEPLPELLRSQGQHGEAARVQAVAALWQGLAGDPSAVDAAIEAVEQCRHDAGAGSLAWAMMICGSTHSRAGRIEEAISYCNDAIRLAATVRAANAEKVAVELRAMVVTQLEEPDHRQALHYLEAAVELADRPLSTTGQWSTVGAVSIGLGLLGYLDAAVESWAALDMNHEQQLVWPTDRVDVDTLRKRARYEWGDAQYESKVRAAAQWSPDQALTALRQSIRRAIENLGDQVPMTAQQLPTPPPL